MIVIILGCEGTEVQPEESLFPVDHYFVNQSDRSLMAVNFTTYTYYPREEVVTQTYKHFETIQSTDSALIRVDTALTGGQLGYVGCLTQAEIQVWLKLSGPRAYVSTWLTSTDSIGSVKDAQRFYRWPEDTLQWEKTESLVLDLE